MSTRLQPTEVVAVDLREGQVLRAGLVAAIARPLDDSAGRPARPRRLPSRQHLGEGRGDKGGSGEQHIASTWRTGCPIAVALVLLIQEKTSGRMLSDDIRLGGLRRRELAAKFTAAISADGVVPWNLAVVLRGGSERWSTCACSKRHR